MDLKRGIFVSRQKETKLWVDPFIKNQTAADYIDSQGADMEVVQKLDTSYVLFYPGDQSVDSELANDARNMAELDPGIYILLFKDCGSYANDWMRHARHVLRQAEGTFPTYP